jgi:hypothetical protein
MCTYKSTSPQSRRPRKLETLAVNEHYFPNNPQPSYPSLNVDVFHIGLRCGKSCPETSRRTRRIPRGALAIRHGPIRRPPLEMPGTIDIVPENDTPKSRNENALRLCRRRLVLYVVVPKTNRPILNNPQATPRMPRVTRLRHDIAVVISKQRNIGNTKTDEKRDRTTRNGTKNQRNEGKPRTIKTAIWSPRLKLMRKNLLKPDKIYPPSLLPLQFRHVILNRMSDELEWSPCLESNMRRNKVSFEEYTTKRVDESDLFEEAAKLLNA